MGAENFNKAAFEGLSTETNGEKLKRTQEQAERMGQHINNAKWMIENAKTPEEKAKAEASLAALQSKAESVDEEIKTLEESDPSALADSDAEIEDNAPVAVAESEGAEDVVDEEETAPTEVKTEEQPKYSQTVVGNNGLIHTITASSQEELSEKLADYYKSEREESSRY